jgi:hypothetical protein
MTRPGRKRKSLARREPNGRIQRPTMQQLTALAIAREDREKVVVLDQPHRRGDTSQLRESALGRFVLDHYADARMARSVYDAGLAFADVVRRWRAARGVPAIDRAGGGLSTGVGPSAATVARWWAQICAVDTRLTYEVSPVALRAVRHLVIDERDAPWLDPRIVKLGLGIVAEEMGKISARRSAF